MLLFPVLALSSLTALWGGWLLADVLFLWFWPGAGPLLKAAAVALCAGAGFGLQMLTSRRQTMFRKVCPDRVTHLSLIHIYIALPDYFQHESAQFNKVYIRYRGSCSGQGVSRHTHVYFQGCVFIPGYD